MTSTPPILVFPPDFWQKIMASSTEMGISMLQTIANSTLRASVPYLPWILGILFLLLILASVKALLGETGMLGSLLYHIFFLGILAIVIWAAGWGIVFNAFFDLVTFALYRFCYWLVGLILQKFRR
jgi:hypothetical protein